MGDHLDEHGQPRDWRFCARHVAERQIDEMIGICKGVLSDGALVEQEVQFIADWLDRNRHAAGRWPCSVLYERVRRALVDGRLDAEEEAELIEVLPQVTGGPQGDTTGESMSSELPLDDPPPTINFDGAAFCLTGKFAFGPRGVCEAAVSERGGIIHASPKRDTRFLVIGLVGSRDWIHSTHGRKIERAIELREKGGDIAIISEEHWVTHL